MDVLACGRFSRAFLRSLQGVNGIDATHMWYLLSFYSISRSFFFLANLTHHETLRDKEWPGKSYYNKMKFYDKE